jgi:uncharacterized membrane protein YhaH (DUF805 family)
MNFDAIKKYAVFSGRARREEFWYFILLNGICGVVASVLDETGVLYGIVILGFLIPGIAVAVRRLHDVDRSGWWYLIIFVPIVGAIFLIVWFCTKGTDGSNRFGSDPLIFTDDTGTESYSKSEPSIQHSVKSSDNAEKIRKLHELKEEGMISEHEFQSKKEVLLKDI